MKKIIAALLALALCVFLAACSNGGESTTEPESESSTQTVKLMKTKLDPNEYILYENIFYNDATPYINQEVNKEGTFTTVYDEFYGRTRYYVWGYNDETKCCDWQWELDITDASNVPPNGSYVTVTGTFLENPDALDKYWIENPVITVTDKYEPDYACDIDMSTMSCTLERVQIANLTSKADKFEGKTVRGYGRMATATSIEDPYYNGSWQITFDKSDDTPAIGMMTIFTGTWSGGQLTNTQLIFNTEESSIY